MRTGCNWRNCVVAWCDAWVATCMTFSIGRETQLSIDRKCLGICARGLFGLRYGSLLRAGDFLSH